MDNQNHCMSVKQAGLISKSCVVSCCFSLKSAEMFRKKCIHHFDFCAEMSQFWYMALGISSHFFHSDSLFIVCFSVSFISVVVVLLLEY